MESNGEIFHCLIIFNHQNEPILNIYDEYFYHTVISPNRNRFENGLETISIENVLMQLFSPIIVSQAAMVDTLQTKFTSIDLYNNQTLIFQKMYGCYLIILLPETCLFRQHGSIIGKKLDLIEWLMCSFYGVCWSQMKFNSDRWIRLLLREMWLMDKTEFNLTFWSIERIDLSSKLKLNERVLEVLVSNSKYLRQVSEKRLKHQLILVGSKLFTLYTSNDTQNNLKTKDNLLFALVSNAIFNRFSRARETPVTDSVSSKSSRLSRTLVQSISGKTKVKETPASSSSSTDEFSSADNELPDIVKTLATMKLTDSFKSDSTDFGSNLSTKEFDCFVTWIENKEGFKYRIVRMFIYDASGLLTPCHLHLIKLARSVIYLGVEENIDNSSQMPLIHSTLDKNIRLLRKLISDYDKTTNVISILKLRIGQAIEKLYSLGSIHSGALKQTYKLFLSCNSNNPDVLERFIKDLLKTFELIYCEYFISNHITVSEKLCKSFLRCFLSVKKEMSDFLSILSMKALRNMSPTSFYPIYPGLVHFIVKTRKFNNSLICPVIDQDFLSDYKIQRLHILVELCQRIGTQLELPISWRQIEICDKNFRCTYMKRKYKITEDKYQEFELTVFHLAEVSYYIVKKQVNLLRNQFLSDQKVSDAPLLDLMS